MPRIHLHAGMHKTGSTSIQATLMNGSFENYHYVQTGGQNHSRMFILLFGDDLVRERLMKKGVYDKGNVKALRRRTYNDLTREIRDCGKENIILSGEGLTRDDFTEGNMLELREFLNQFTDQIDVYAYVRSPMSLAQSAFQQKAKFGSRDSLSFPPIDYRERLEPLDSVFGSENVHLTKFDRKTMVGGDAVLDFTSKIGLEITPDQIVTSNESQSAEVVSLLLAQNKFGVERTEMPALRTSRGALEDSLIGFGDNKLNFAQELMAPMLEKMAPSLKWIEERMGMSLADKPNDTDFSIASEADIVQMIFSNMDAFEAFFMDEVRKQENPERRAAEMMDMLLMMHASRKAGKSKSRKARKRI